LAIALDHMSHARLDALGIDVQVSKMPSHAGYIEAGRRLWKAQFARILTRNEYRDLTERRARLLAAYQAEFAKSVMDQVEAMIAKHQTLT